LKGIDTIINLAAVHRDDVYPRSRYDDVNVQGSVNICETARKYNINKIIFTSSVAIYGFAEANTDEKGKPNYFNDYGITKHLAEQVYKEWHAEDPDNRTLVIVRPTVIFGEGNRGNVYNLLNQIASKKFIMFGNGKNKKSMAYVENVAAFLEYSLSFKPGIHLYNYIDKPDFDMNDLISAFLGMGIGYFADFVAMIFRITLPVSSIRVKKFLGTTQFSSSVIHSGFLPPVSLDDGLSRTIKYEFIEDNSDEKTFKTE
jgi:nucleoside-diphosphate-sugar epimerase